MTSPWSDADVAALDALATRHKIQALDIVKVMSHESGCLPDPPHNGPARGLIQFDGTLESLGWKGAPDAFAAQGVSPQLPFVDRFFGWFPQVAGRDLAGVYTACFIPAQIHVTADLDATICGASGPYASYYRDNARGFDSAGKGTITGRDMVASAEHAFAHCSIAQDLAARLARLHTAPVSSPSLPIELVPMPPLGPDAVIPGENA